MKPKIQALHSRKILNLGHTPQVSQYDHSLSFLDNLKLRDLSAYYYECEAGWVVFDRIVDDDMFYYFLSGKAQIDMENKPYRVGQGDLVHIPRGTKQSARNLCGETLYCIVVHYTALALDSLNLSNLLELPQVHNPDRERVYPFLLQACREYVQRLPGWQDAMHGCILAVLLYLIREIINDVPLTKLRHITVKTKRILPALNFLQENISNDVSMNELARICSLSESHFRRLFREATGQSPLNYFIRLRIEKACRLLRTGDYTVEAIASEVGYQETAAFANKFRQIMEVSPGKFRQTLMT